MSAQRSTNHYGMRIIPADEFDGEHYAAIIPMSGGSPPVCSCGWTRHGGFELWEHLADMRGES